MDSETLDLSARNHKKLAARTSNHHARKVVNLQGVKTATTVKVRVDLKTETPGNATDSTKNLDLAANPLVKVNQVVKLNLGKENPPPARREVLEAPNEATATQNPDKTPTAKKLLNNVAVESNFVDGAR